MATLTAQNRADILAAVKLMAGTSYETPLHDEVIYRLGRVAESCGFMSQGDFKYKAMISPVATLLNFLAAAESEAPPAPPSLPGLGFSYQPSFLDIASGMSWYLNGQNDFAGVTAMEFTEPTLLSSVSISNKTTVQTVNYPNLTLVDPDGLYGGSLGVASLPALTSLLVPLLTRLGDGATFSALTRFKIDDCDALTEFEAPVMAMCTGSLQVSDCAVLTSLSFPLLTDTYHVTIVDNPLLTGVNMPLWSPRNNTLNVFQGNAFTQAQVDSLLARGVANGAFVSGSLILDGGTMAVPSAQGVADAATLTGRGVLVAVNV